MKTILSVAIVTIILMLLSGFSLLGMNPQASRYDRMIAEITRFSLTESALYQDILNARAGLLRNYDPLNQELERLQALLNQLRENGADRAVTQPLQALVDTQAGLTEQFKSNNALQQNSLAYFGLMSGRFGVDVQDGPLAAAMTALSTAVLRLTLDTSPAVVAEVEDALNRFATVAEAGGHTQLVNGILMHGRMLHRILPATDQIVAALYDLPRSERLEALRSNVLAHQQASRSTARDYRALLYVASVILLALLVYSGLQLKRYLRALRRRADFEHAIAAISMSFVNARPDEIDQRVESAIEIFAHRLGADRAYFVAGTDPPHLHRWSRDGTDWPPGWPNRAAALTARLAQPGEIAYVPAVEAMHEGEDKDLLHRAGLLAWISVSPYGQNPEAGVLGFDFIRTAISDPSNDGGLIRMAADTIANAVSQAALERDRARLESSLQQVRRMETVGAMASGIAHNFNNIIGVILGYTEMEEQYAGSDSRLASNLEGIRHAAERARDLIDKILTFGRPKELLHQTIALRRLMAETQALLSVSFPSRACLHVAPVPEEAQLRGDPVQLQQVIMNLCNNAMQAMDGCGVVQVTVDIDTVELPTHLSHGTLVSGRYVRLAVRDAGRGIGPQALGRLFDPFFTTRPKGNGLGLATVREIVRSHGGAIDVSSSPGEGSTFTVWLPQRLDHADRSISVSPIPGKGETILVIDEDRANLLRHEEIVAALGYEPVGFAEPSQVLRAIETDLRRFDALLIGNLGPAHRALELATATHRILPELPILLTTSADDVDADALTGAGVSELVCKPLQSAELAGALSRQLAG